MLSNHHLTLILILKVRFPPILLAKLASHLKELATKKVAPPVQLSVVSMLLAAGAVIPPGTPVFIVGRPDLKCIYQNSKGDGTCQILVAGVTSITVANSAIAMMHAPPPIAVKKSSADEAPPPSEPPRSVCSASVKKTKQAALNRTPIYMPCLCKVLHNPPGPYA